MDTKKEDFKKYLRAKKRVEDIKSFYAHIVIYVLVNFFLLLFKGSILNFFVSMGVKDEGFLNWLGWNIVFVPILWGLVLLIVGVYLLKLKPGFFRDWEEKQIRKYLEE